MTTLQDQCKRRKESRREKPDYALRNAAWAIYHHIKDAETTSHDKEIIRELSRDRSVNFIAEKMEIDILLAAAIIKGVI